MTVTTRGATADDIPMLVQMMHEFYAAGDYRLDRQWAAASFAALLANESYGAVWMVFAEGETAGYAVLTICYSMEYGGLAGHIDDLFIRPHYRRQGLGEAVLRALFADCARRGVLAVHVETANDNIAAKALYSRCGLSPQDDGREVFTSRLDKIKIRLDELADGT